MVLSVLYPTVEAEGTESLKVDIIAVHGLNGDPVKTWTNSETKAFWLQDYLPLDIAGARVLSFGYNADVAFCNTTADVIDHAKDLLSSLVDKREEHHELQRPIIFIAHSLGGIVVKQALLQARIETQYNSINKHTVGIVFLGTPHRGSEKASYGKILANLATAVMNKPTSRLVSALQANSDSLMRLTSDFKFQLPNYHVVSFYEMRTMEGFSTLIVEKYSALLEVDREDQIPVDANHQDLCKFRTRNDPVYEKLFKRIGRMMKAKYVERTNTSPNVSSFRNKHYEVPHNVSSVFTGRKGIYQQLSENCLPLRAQDSSRKQRRFVLYGLGGSGKTQMCLKFAQDYRENFWGIFWIDASSNETAEQGFLNIARICGLEADSKVVKRWLSNIEDPWLLIIDNADDPLQDVSEYFPTGDRGAILLTTRNPDCKIHATVGSSEFGQMEPEEAVTLLLKTAAVGDVSHDASRNLARPIVKTLGYLALAIVQAGAVIRQKLYSMEEYCGVYSRQRKELLSRQLVQAKTDYKYTVYTTWEVSINRIENMSNRTARDAIDILQLFSFMHFEGISEEILKEAWKNMHSRRLSKWEWSYQLRMLCENNSKDWEPRFTREALILLSSFSLIAIDGVSSHISMHPLVHMWAKDRLVEAEQERRWKIAASTLAMSISWGFQVFDYDFRRSLLPHVDSCLDSHDNQLFTIGDGELERFQIANKFALVYQERGRFQEAVELREKVLKARKRTLGEEHPGTLRSMNSLAISYSDLGRRQEALELKEKVLEASKRTLGEEHPNTLVSMNNLAVIYSNLGRRQEALELREKVLEARKRTLGEEHPDTLGSMSSLAISYSDLSRRQEALELKEKVLEARKRTLGEEHPDTLGSMNGLAISYSDLGRRQEALELWEKVLEARKRTLGEEHPDTLVSMNGLAISYSDLGRRQEALELREKVLEASKRTLGEEHLDTLGSMNDLAMSYSNLGRRQEALELKEKVLEAWTRALGEEHSDTLGSMDNLAIIYNDLGRKQEALELREKALEARKRTLGEEHPDTLGSMNGLAISYSDLGRRQEALELREKVLEASKRTLGEEHPDTLASMNGLAISYSDLGRRQEALELRQKVLEARKRTLGEEHPDTLGSMSGLAISYSDLGRRQEALELKEKVLEASKRTLGEEHPDTLGSMNNLAISYSDLGRRQEALELREKVLEARKRMLGEEHPDTLGAMNDLAISYNDLGQSQDALELSEKVLEARKRLLGDDHPDTLISIHNLAVISLSRGPSLEAFDRHANFKNSPGEPLDAKSQSRWNLRPRKMSRFEVTRRSRFAIVYDGR